MKPRSTFIIALAVYMCVFLGGGPFTTAVLAKITMKPTDEEVKIITIVKGDTLWDLAAKHLQKPWRWPWFKQYNDYTNPDLIYPGEKMQVPLKWLVGVVESEESRLRKELQDLRAMHDECQQQLAAAKAEIAELRQQLDALRDENASLRKALQSKDDEIAELRRLLAARPEASPDLSELRGLLEDTAKRDEVRQQIEATQERLSARIDQLEESLKASLAAMADSQSRSVSIDSDILSITSELTKLRDGLLEIQNRMGQEPPTKGNKKFALLAAVAGGIAWVAVNALSNIN